MWNLRLFVIILKNIEKCDLCMLKNCVILFDEKLQNLKNFDKNKVNYDWNKKRHYPSK